MWEDEAVRWRSAQSTILVALALLGVGVAGCGGAKPADPQPVRGLTVPEPPAPATVYATVDGAPVGTPLPVGYLGLSLEYTALEAYTGADPGALDPVFVQLLRNLGTAGGGLSLRIGGNSTDATWWPMRRSSPPPGVSYALTPAWLASARALADAVGAKLILGVNLATGRPRVAAAEGRALVRGIGAQRISALEVGNEPDVYRVFPWYQGRRGAVFARGAGYDLTAFVRQLAQWAHVLPNVPLAGPAVAKLPWLSGLPELLQGTPRLGVITVHRYPLQGCLTNPSSPAYPSIPNLLSDRASAGLAAAIEPYVSYAHGHRLQFRVDELNSASLAGCLGRTGVSNTFASALWMLDTLFHMASAGVDGVNVHTLPGAGYELFTFSRAAGGWRAFVHPDYYGMLMFAQAFPVGAQLLPVQVTPGAVKVWATRGLDGHTRVTLINQDSRPRQVQLQLPLAGGPGQLEWLRAPSLAAGSGVTLGGRSFGAATATGVLPPPRLETVASVGGSYSITLPAASAALLTR
jgi:hypothetical protein